MRKSQIDALVAVCRSGLFGYYDRGRRLTFAWLASRGLVERALGAWEFTLTQEGSAALERLGLCTRCGSSGWRCEPKGMGRTWLECPCGASQEAMRALGVKHGQAGP